MRGVGVPMLGASIAGLLGLALLAIGLVLAFANERSNAAEQTRRASVQAEILAGSVSAALAFDDVGTVKEYLGALRADHEIEAAGIYGEDGSLIAGFSSAAGLPRRVAVAEPRVQNGELTVTAPVAQGGLKLGTIYLRSVVEPWGRRATRYIGIAVILILSALLIAVLGSSYAAASSNFRKLQSEVEARERAEAALRQAQKMEAMGQLTGGVAHDFNNLLMAASSGIELLERTDDPGRRERLLRGIRDALDRGAKLNEQLLTFARRSPVKAETIDVAARLASIRDLLDRSLREDVRVEYLVEPDVWPIEVDPAQFDIALVNVAVNARDAMPTGGVIEIGAVNRAQALDGRDAVEVSVSDHGTGMSADALEKAFEPFFTTKGVGRGTGLGLSQVYGFVRSAGGTAAIDSEPGKGTTIRLLLPRSANAALAEQPAAAAAESSLCPAKLLIVEDDDGIADMLMQMLEQLGCGVARASTAREGLDMFDKDRPDLVLSDMVMPGEWGGLDLAREIRRRAPQLPLLLMTGYSSAASEARDEGFRLLEKPFKLNQLATVLGEVLSSSRADQPPLRPSA